MTYALVFAANNGTLGYEPWITAPDGSGATLLADLNPGSFSSVSSFVPGAALGSLLLFRAADGTSGQELWSTNGTSVTRISDIVFGPGDSAPSDFVSSGGLVFFEAFTATSGRELWVTDGTEAGTMQVRDIRAGATGSDVREMIGFGNGVLFAADDGSGYDAYFSNGTELGTRRLTDINGLSGDIEFDPDGVVGGRAFFAAKGAGGEELWVTDGTEAGTARVSDIFPGLGDSFPDEITAYNGIVLFDANDGVNGEELWRSDGTNGGTFMIRDIRAGANASNPDGLKVVGSKVLFTANDGVSGRELWATDGTQAGTQKVVEINPGLNSAFATSNDQEAFFLVGDGSRAVFAADNGVNGTELWVSDGTAVGTRLVKDINAGGAGSAPNRFVEAGGLVYFTANDGIHGRELWVTDGTTAGTMLVEDIRSGLTDTDISILGVIDINGAPTGLALSNDTVVENANAGTVIGTLSATDPDGDALSYLLTDSAGGRVSVSGNQLVVAGGIDFETTPEFDVTVQVRDPSGASSSRTFTIDVIDVNDPTEGSDDLFGTPGADTIDGLGGNDTITGRGGDDRLIGSGGNDTLIGNSGDDVLIGKAQADTLRGGGGGDLLKGNAGRDLLIGGGGSDRLVGGGMGDVLNGSAGNDRLFGGAGADMMKGGRGTDDMRGGKGADTFDMRGPTGTDRILDFGTGADVIDLESGLAFSDLTITDTGANTRIQVGSDVIVLVGFEAADVTQDMFDF